MLKAAVYLTLELGKKQALKPAPRVLIEALKTVEVTHKDEGRSGFQLTFEVGRNRHSAEKNILDYPLLIHNHLEPFSRIRIQVSVGATAHVLMDGTITNHQFSPSSEAGGSTFTVTGEDISVMMDIEDKTARFPRRRADNIVRELLSNYRKDYGILPDIQRPSQQDQPRRHGRIPAQQTTDLKYINQLAKQHGCVFFVTPAPRRGKNKKGPHQNIAYWGPPQRNQQTQPPLSFNMGAYTNVESVSFQYNALGPVKMSGYARNKKPITVPATERKPPLSKRPAITHQDHVRVQKFRLPGRRRNQALINAQTTVDKSVDSVVSANCEIDTSRYGSVVLLRGVVSLRGVGHSYDGLYYVKSVTHKLSQGDYKQSLALTRDGLGTTIKKVSA